MNTIIKKNATNYGLILGVILVLLNAGIYAIDLKLFTEWYLGVISMITYIVIGILVLNTTKKEMNGQINFKEAFTTYFIASAIGALCGVLFNILLFNVIDVAAKEELGKIAIEKAVELMSKFGTSTEEISKAVAKMQETDNYSVVSQLKGYAFGLLIGAIFSAIFALIYKTKNRQDV